MEQVLRTEQEKWLADAKAAVKQQAFYMKRAIVSRNADASRGKSKERKPSLPFPFAPRSWRGWVGRRALHPRPHPRPHSHLLPPHIRNLRFLFAALVLNTRPPTDTLTHPLAPFLLAWLGSTATQDEDSLRDVFKYSSAMLGELRTSLLSPQKYYELYMRAFDELRGLEMFFEEQRGKGHRASGRYELVQHAGNVRPRLYLLVTVGAVFIRSHESPIKSLLKDLVEMCSGIQHPVRGLFLRSYLTQVSKEALQLIENKVDTELLLAHRRASADNPLAGLRIDLKRSASEAGRGKRRRGR